MSHDWGQALSALALMIVFFGGFALKVHRVKSGKSSKSVQYPARPRSFEDTEDDTVRCPYCGSPAMIKGSYWECGYCGDSGRL